MNKYDRKMWDKGYRYKLTFLYNSCHPLYVKTLTCVADVAREWKNNEFRVEELGEIYYEIIEDNELFGTYSTEESALLDIYKYNEGRMVLKKVQVLRSPKL